MKQLMPGKKGLIYYWYGASLLLLNSLHAKMHRHYPIEIYIGLDTDFKINFGAGWKQYRAVVINSNQPHQLKSNDGLAFLLLDPCYYQLNSIQGLIFSEQNYYQPDHSLTLTLVEKISRFKRLPRTCTEAKKLTDEIVTLLFNLDLNQKEMDARIQFLINRLHDIAGRKISASQLAQTVNLSESRLAHLFKEQTRTPIRRYLLWLKLRQAIKSILKGQSFTTAAYESGFSDSAHLSRTYRQMFGLSPSDLLKAYSCIEVIFSF